MPNRFAREARQLIYAIVVCTVRRDRGRIDLASMRLAVAVSGLFTDRRFSNSAEASGHCSDCDNVVGWLGTTGVLAALRRRAIEGGRIGSSFR